tara:strand:+ start:346 stop:1041 length:696 start_codon:yes stop_codon:yes gene_type:complete
MNFFEIVVSSFELIFAFDKTLYEIIILSFRVSGIALIFSSIFAIILSFILIFKSFYFKNTIIVILNSLMGIPPVLVGLVVFLLFAKDGPFGVFEILFTPYAMIIAQFIIIFPIIASLSYELFLKIWNEYRDHFRSLNIPFKGRVSIILRNSLQILFTIIMTGFGRAISEVGAIMIVGGNIENYTRSMTTAISLETRKGNFDYAIALGIFLILLTILINVFVYLIKVSKKNR